MKTNLLRDIWIRRLFITLFKSMVMLLVVSLIPFRIHADSNITEESIFSGRKSISLNKIFRETGKNTGGLTSYLPSFLFNYEITVRGIVSTGTGDPMPGVNVIQKGTTHGTTTDADGRYSLSVSEGNTVLVFSFIGYATQEVAVNGRSVIDITLIEDVQSLEEVVVIGYGTVKKENLTGSVTQIKSKALEKRAITTVSEAFAGQFSGVQAQQTSGVPGSELTIKIRGIKTINASNAPLYVIDGIPGDMKDLNPSDIASIEILKDASSSAIYGARGAGGVVLISTKKGMVGKTIFDFNMFYGFQKVDKIIDMMDRDEFIAFNIWGKNQNYLRSGGSLSDPMSMRPAVDQYPDSWLDPETLPDINWQKEIYRIAPIQNYQLTVSGGNDVGTYLLSTSYMKQEGVMRETDYQRATFRLNTSLNVGEKIKVGLNIAPSFSKSHNPVSNGSGSVSHIAVNMPPIAGLQSNTVEWGQTIGVLSAFVNPLQRLKEVHDETLYNKALTNLWGEFALVESLLFKSQFGYNYTEARNSSFNPYNTNPGATPSYGSSSVNDWYTWSFQNTLTFNPEISPSLELDMLLGQSLEGSKYYSIYAAKNGYPNDLIYTLNVASTPTAASTFESRSNIVSVFGRINFNVKDKYLLTMNVRRDGSSKFGSDTKWGWFPSASIGWKLSHEEFLKNADWIDLLKLRVSAGIVGNNSIGDYESIPLLGVSNYNLNGAIASGLAPSSIGNPDLRWETKFSRGIGLDLNTFNNRVQANVDYYVDNTLDMLLNVPIPRMSGYSSMRMNIGEVENRGWEFELTSSNIRSQLTWTTSVNISRNLNEVKKLGTDNAPIILSMFGPTAYITKVGEPIGSYYMYKSDGLLLEDSFDENGSAIVPVLPGQEMGNIKIIDLNNDAVINPDDMTIVGNNQPDFIWGITNTLNYKNFELNILLQGAQGGELFLIGSRHMDVGQIQGMNQFPRWVRSWKQDYSQDENPYPKNTNVDLSWDGKTPNRFGNNVWFNDTWIYDASFIRIKNISLGYNLPAAFIEKIGIRSAKIYIMGDNVYIWDNYKGTTPETNSFGNETTMPGADYGTYPLSRKYSVGVNITF